MTTDTIVITDAGEGAVMLSGPTAITRYPLLPGILTTPLSWVLNMVTDRGAIIEPLTLVVPSAPDLDDIAGHWRVYGLALDSGWYQLFRPDNPRVHLCVLDRLSGDYVGELFSPGWEAGRITDALRAYRDLLGAPYYASAGTSGAALMRELGDRQTVRWRPEWRLPAELPDSLPQPTDLRWHATEDRLARRTGHRWDVRAAYAASAYSAYLGTDVPQAGDTTEWDPHAAGWWCVDAAEAASVLPQGGPPLWDHRSVLDSGRVWLSTPLMTVVIEHWRQLGDITPIKIHGTYRSRHSTRHLRAWASVMRDARYTMIGERDPDRWSDHVVRAVKRSYTHAVGQLSKPGGRIYRPDWRAQIIDLARANLYRKLHRVWEATGHWPTSINVDCVWYPDWVVAGPRPGAPTTSFDDCLGVGPYIGRFRYEGYEISGKPAAFTEGS